MRRGAYHCKCHDEPYTDCPLCRCLYCPKTWPVCPRTSWAPAHAETDEERGRRDRVLMDARNRYSRKDDTP
jgi:hypothetical protein